MRLQKFASLLLATCISSFTLPAFLPASERAALAQSCVVGEKISVSWRGKYYPATVLRVSEDGVRCYITYEGYDNSWDEWVGPGRIAEKVRGCRVGQKVQVLWKGSYYPATVLNVKGSQCYIITYEGYDNSWDEWVGPARIRF